MENIKHYSVLNHALACGASARFRELKLKREYPERGRYEFMKDLCNHFAWYLDPDYEKIQKKFDEDYLEGLFSLPSHYEAARELDLWRAKRGVKFFNDHGYEFVKAETVTVPIGKDVNGTYFDRVTLGCFVFRAGNRYSAFMVKNSVSVYSRRARRPERKVQASLELLLMILGLSEKYPGLDASILFLNVENEKEGKLAVSLPDKNVVTLKATKEEAYDLLMERLKMPEYLSCDSCSFSDLCGLGKMQVDKEENAKAEAAPSKGVSGGLTRAQQEIVDHREGPLCCIAVPGAGKTHSLVSRLEAMVSDGISPNNILFITFTRKAAKEIEERVKRFLGDGELPMISTFHAFALKVIRESADDRYRNIRLAETLEKKQLIERVLMENPKKMEKAPFYLHGKFGLLDYVEKAISYYELHGEEDFRKRYVARDADTVHEIYERYKSLYEKEGYISYDEMVPVALEILRAHPDELHRLQSRFTYIMADEFQDVNEEQAELLYLLAANRNLVVVGDDDQTIYAWRGGTNRYLLNFLNDWPDAKLVRMEDNFRSVDKILSAAEDIIFQNTNRISKRIIAHKESELRPVLLKNCLADHMPWLLSLALKKGYKPGDIAILARKNSELDKIAGHLYNAGIPYMEPKEELVRDETFVRIYDVLTLFYKEMQDDIALYRTFVREGCSFDEDLSGSGSLYDRMIAHYLMPAIEPYTTMDEYKEGFERMGISDYGLAGHTLLKCFKAILYSPNVEAALTEIMECLEIKRHAFDAVSVLLRKADEKQISSIKGLYEYMKNMILYLDDTDIEYPEEDGKINLLSCHKAKGKEYPLVIVFSVDSFRDTEEDRCLLYVAMTRAKKCLYLTEHPFGNSELLQDLDEEMFIIKEVAL